MTLTESAGNRARNINTLQNFYLTTTSFPKKCQQTTNVLPANGTCRKNHQLQIATVAVIEKFVELQNTDLNEGLVIREFVDLSDLTTHSKSGMLLKHEYRLFLLNGQLLGSYDYCEEGEYSADEHPL